MTVTFSVVSESPPPTLQLKMVSTQKEDLFSLFDSLEKSGGHMAYKRQREKWHHKNACHTLAQCLPAGGVSQFLNLSVGSVSTLQNSCGPLLNSRQSLTILNLALALYNMSVSTWVRNISLFDYGTDY